MTMPSGAFISVISYLPRYSGWLDYVLTDGSYRRREVIRCQTVGEELRLTFTGVPYGTYSLEESGISVCKFTISANNTQAEITLP